MKAKGGRPSSYRKEYADQARKLCLLGMADEQIAFFFDIDIATLAAWAWEYEAFFDAITPPETARQEYRQKIEAHRAKRRARRKTHRASNVSAKIESAMRSRIWSALKRGMGRAGLVSRLRYTIDELRAHLEHQFVPGMSWGNYGKWHVDHKKPCAKFNMANPEQFNECWALENLQPLWAGDNIRKGASYAGP